MKTKQIRVDPEVIEEIERHWQPRDTPNSVLRRLLKLNRKKKTADIKRTMPMATDSGG